MASPWTKLRMHTEMSVRQVLCFVLQHELRERVSGMTHLSDEETPFSSVAWEVPVVVRV